MYEKSHDRPGYETSSRSYKDPEPSYSTSRYQSSGDKYDLPPSADKYKSAPRHAESSRDYLAPAPREERGYTTSTRRDYSRSRSPLATKSSNGYKTAAYISSSKRSVSPSPRGDAYYTSRPSKSGYSTKAPEPAERSSRAEYAAAPSSTYTSSRHRSSGASEAPSRGGEDKRRRGEDNGSRARYSQDSYSVSASAGAGAGRKEYYPSTRRSDEVP